MDPLGPEFPADLLHLEDLGLLADPLGQSVLVDPLGLELPVDLLALEHLEFL